MLSANELLVLSERDYELCSKLESSFPDEFAVSGAAYHIQQAVEKALKALILLHGGAPAFTHNISKLSLHCDELGVKLPEELDDIAEALTLWETQTRYDPFCVISMKKYEKAKAVSRQLAQNARKMIESFG
ncbi:MAG: HEPN domain-containing protein [Clostridia bacterium]|nr:HEPN domain-containing protein [Clostridia bacterium]